MRLALAVIHQSNHMKDVILMHESTHQMLSTREKKLLKTRNYSKTVSFQIVLALHSYYIRPLLLILKPVNYIFKFSTFSLSKICKHLSAAFEETVYVICFIILSLSNGKQTKTCSWSFFLLSNRPHHDFWRRLCTVLQIESTATI